MSKNLDDLLPTAKQIRKEAALKEAEKADEFARHLAAAEAEKKKLIDKFNKPSGLSEEEDQTRRNRNSARRPERLDRSPGLLISEFALHRSRSGHQSDGKWLGEDADGNAQGNLPTLGRPPATARLSHPLSNHRFSGRRTRRHQYCSELGRLIVIRYPCAQNERGSHRCHRMMHPSPR